MANEAGNREAFQIQAHYCDRMGAPIYARVCASLASTLDRASRTGARILDWSGEPTRDALPLRLMGGLHALVRAGADSDLVAVFAGTVAEDAATGAILARVLVEHDSALLPWLDGPPQTNEPGRSASLMTGLLAIAARHGHRMELLEIGSSAGLNLLIARYGFDLGGVRVGPLDAPVTIAPEWRGAPPAAVPIEITSVRGCDVQPLDATDPEVAARLLAYCWPEMPRRFTLLENAIAMLGEQRPALVRADAAEWAEAALADPQPEGVTRALMHSVVWQYLPPAIAERVRAAMTAAGAQATADRPLAWLAVEPDRSLARHIIRIRHWPGPEDWEVVGSAHAHGLWVEPGPPPATETGIALPAAAVTPT